MFDKIKSPWFEPEFDLGTDIQICKKAKAVGFKVACDTSITIGHVLNQREVITVNNRHRIAVDVGQVAQGIDQGMDKQWAKNSALALYRFDAEEYMGVKNFVEMAEVAQTYSMSDFDDYENTDDYYKSKGNEQLARQVVFHHLPSTRSQMEYFHTLLNTNNSSYGCDYGCGSSPVGFELAMQGHKVDFIDVDGAGAYEFTKWRAKKRGINCGFEFKGPYDYVLMLDSIEHIQDWEYALERVVLSLKDGGGIVTNYFGNQDFSNIEHISMNQKKVKEFLIDKGVYPVNDFLWMKRDVGNLQKEVA